VELNTPPLAGGVSRKAGDRKPRGASPELSQGGPLRRATARPIEDSPKSGKKSRHAATFGLQTRINERQPIQTTEKADSLRAGGNRSAFDFKKDSVNIRTPVRVVSGLLDYVATAHDL
jgi:hypothetical protein